MWGYKTTTNGISAKVMASGGAKPGLNSVLDSLQKQNFAHQALQ
ncbi:MAG: hypothetical protein CM15mP62_33070 [Rhodospirillaceae bacterium]|nr:MAG: hypothetical protein CM15mP62_33070 [Rhodospirillaceae bacterium]